MRRTLLWFRGKDLRVEDHEGLHRALAADEVIPVFVLDPYFFDPERAQALPHRMQYLLDALEELAGDLRQLGSELIIEQGRSVDVIPTLAAEWAVDEVIAQGWTEGFGRQRDARIEAQLSCPLTLVDGETMVSPGSVRTQQGGAYSVFTPYWRRFMATAQIAPPRPRPSQLPPLPSGCESSVRIPSLDELGIQRNHQLLKGGSTAAKERLSGFLSARVGSYKTARNRPDKDGSSRLGPDLKFGALSARQIWAAAQQPELRSESGSFRRQLVWREFAHDLVWNQPRLLTEPFRPKFREFPWIGLDEHWEAWVEGRTGYPIVDAASRQLLATGFVPNRARMITASFLTKHLLIDYRRGEAHFMKWLTDGDWIQNNFGWQWSAGCGCDAQPYFRVFNPILQGKKFDPQGTYVRRWGPELEGVPKKWIHTPWLAERSLFAADYPAPIVDHATARKRFLEHAKAYLATV